MPNATENIFTKICNALPNEPTEGSHFWATDMVFADTEERANHLADLLDDMGYTACTGYYDPNEDEKAGTVDSCTGWYYIDV